MCPTNDFLEIFKSLLREALNQFYWWHDIKDQIHNLKNIHMLTPSNICIMKNSLFFLSLTFLFVFHGDMVGHYYIVNESSTKEFISK